jgi:heme-degrading monooxygenase HmoA
MSATADGTHPFRIMLRMLIKPGMEEDFARVWSEVGDSVTSHPANLGQWLCRGEEEAGVYYIISDWVDELRFREFETSAGHLEHRQKLHPFRSGGSMVTMRVVAVLPGGTGSASGPVPTADGSRGR